LAQRTRYRIAGQPLLVEAEDAWAAGVIDTLFAGWHLAPDAQVNEEPSALAIVMRADATPAPIPAGLQKFEIAGGGTCYTDGTTSYIDIDGSIVAIGKPGVAAAEIWTSGSPEAPALTRLVTYALSAALRQRRLFELHGGAVVHPKSGRGVSSSPRAKSA
jgi:hypothetical protein